MDVPQICIPSIHKSTSPTRFLRKKDFQKNKSSHVLADDLPKERVFLHTISRTGKSPISGAELKGLLLEHYRAYHEWADTIVVPDMWAENRYKSVYIDGYGIKGVRFEYGKYFDLYKKVIL